MEDEGTLAGPEEPPDDREFADLPCGWLEERRELFPPSPLLGGGT